MRQVATASLIQNRRCCRRFENIAIEGAARDINQNIREPIGLSLIPLSCRMGVQLVALWIGSHVDHQGSGRCYHTLLHT